MKIDPKAKEILKEIIIEMGSDTYEEISTLLRPYIEYDMEEIKLKELRMRMKTIFSEIEMRRAKEC
jgi:hypothetical protein